MPSQAGSGAALVAPDGQGREDDEDSYHPEPARAARRRPPSRPGASVLTACVVTDTGWCSAKTRSQPGMVLTGTKLFEAKTKGAIIGKAAACADSGSPTSRPTVASIQERM